MKKRLGVKLLCGLGMIALVGCSHSNPLDQYSHASVARVLLASAVTADMKLGLASHASQAGYNYEECMSGENSKDKKTCQSIYKLMAKELRRKYSGIRVSDITDKKLWSYVKGYYQENAFDRLPEE